MLSSIEILASRILSLIITIVISPILLLIYFICYVQNGYPVIFKSERLGYRNKIFKLYKFRTMTNEVNPSCRSITHFGKFLRRSSLDELPQLINILFGQMNFVGPRPLPKESYSSQEMKINRDKRLSVLPGLTGLSQINTKGKPRTTQEKLIYDLIYVKSHSFKLDAYIIVMTFKALYLRFTRNKTGGTL